MSSSGGGAMFEDRTEAARLLFPQLRKRFAGELLALERARAKLYARISHPAAMLAGESYKVHTPTARFQWFVRDKLTAEGPMQVIGAYKPADESWRWAGDNPGIPVISTREVDTKIKNGDELLRRLRGYKLFNQKDSFCETLAQSIAVQAGYIGAYPVPQNDTIVYLALKLAPPGATSYDNVVWCSYCGRYPSQVKHMLAGRACALCSDCVEQFREVVAEADLSEQGEASKSLPPCLMCGDRKPRVFAEYGALCAECVEFAEEMLRQKQS